MTDKREFYETPAAALEEEIGKELYEALREESEGAGETIVEFHDSLDSTQIRARELAGAGARKALVVTREQTAGRGRLARRWESPKGGGIYFSILFRPSLPPSLVHLVNIAAALAVEETLRLSLGVETLLKWPNDLLLSVSGPDKNEKEAGGKVCGILSESFFSGASLDCCVTGIGINFYAPGGCGSAGGIRLEGEKEPGAADLLPRAVRSFFGWIGALEREGSGRMLRVYSEKCASVGRLVVVETDSETLTGRCSGIGGDGELLVETPEGTRRFHVADVTHARLS
jgi:BirA family biotin operon repressor/biotin-[acetyl-CoA-carboxylase] ligase